MSGRPTAGELLLPGREDSPGGGGSAVHRHIRRKVLDRILSGRAGAGERMGVSSLAAETGYSRTPVRETLLQLEREGFLTLEENRGFFVRELTEREARELYPVLHALEDLALTAAGRPTAEHLERLEVLNERLSRSRDPEKAIVLNFAWHRLLTEPCDNRELSLLLRRYRMRVFRYEHAYYAPGEERVAYSVELHRRILVALRAGDVREARRILERHWIGDYSLYLPGDVAGVPVEGHDDEGRSRNRDGRFS